MARASKWPPFPLLLLFLRDHGHRPSRLVHSSSLLPSTPTVGNGWECEGWRISLYHPSLRPLLTCRTLGQVLQAHGHLIVSGLFFKDPFAASRVLKAAADLHSAVGYAELVFRHIRPCPDAFCLNILVKARSRSSNPRAAITFYFEMLNEGYAHNSFVFPPLMNACCRIPSLDEGEKCHGQAVKNGVDDVVHVQNALINMYATCGAISSARFLFDGMSHRDLVSWNSMVGGYAKSGDLITARDLFERMPDRNTVSWNIMISAYLKARTPKYGLNLFRKMVNSGLRGSMTTMVSILTACSRLRRLMDGRSIHGFCIRNIVEVNTIFQTALISMYSRCRKVDIARLIFNETRVKNLICWNAMILGHCIHGSPEDGLCLYEDMVRGGCRVPRIKPTSQAEGVELSPDEVTFVGVLCACTRAGLLTKGKEYFDQMANLYHIGPTFAHYWCMANLYGSLGFVKEAEDVLRCMPMEKEPLLWSSMFWLCRFHGDIELGEKIAKRLIELEPLNCSHYSLLWNVYAAAGRWNDIGELKMRMKERGVVSMPGHTLVDLSEIVHNFKVGDRSKPEMENIHVLMDELAETFRLRKKHSLDTMEGG